MTALEQQLTFLREIDKLKTVIRQSPLLDKSRRENSAEHSWHLAMYALILSEYASGTVNPSRVIKMLLLHDVVEIDVGDHPIHRAYSGERYRRSRRPQRGCLVCYRSRNAMSSIICGRSLSRQKPQMRGLLKPSIAFSPCW